LHKPECWSRVWQNLNPRRTRSLHWRGSIALPPVGTPELQRAIGNPEPARCAREISVLFMRGYSDGDVFGGAPDLLEARTEEDGALYGALELRVVPAQLL